LTGSRNVLRKGAQLPRIESVPRFSDSLGDDVADFAAELAGLELDPWQRHVLVNSLGLNASGGWAAFRAALVVPRQNGKNALIEAREIAGLFLLGERLIIHTAHEYATARESMLSLMNRIKASPELMKQVKGFEGDLDKDFSGMKTGNDPGITLKNGNRLVYRARSKGSGRGFTGDLVILDEAYALKMDEMAALLPTMAAKSVSGNPQVWFTSSAGMPESDLLASMRQEGIDRSSDRLAYFEWSAPDDAKPDDREGWYTANPGLGYRISEEFIRDEFDTLVIAEGEDSQFKRERLGIWAKLGGESVFASGVWSGLADADSMPGPALVFAVEVAGNRESASIALLSVRADGLTHVEVVENRLGTSWIGSRLAELQAKWSPLAIVAVAGGHVDSLIPSWKRDGVRVKLIRFTEYVQACGVVHDLIVQGKLRHLDDAVLNGAVDGVKQKFYRDGASWYWSRASSNTDITSLVAVTVAVAGLESKASSRPAGEKRKMVIL